MFSSVSTTRSIVSPIGHVQTMFNDYSANINDTLRFLRANVSKKKCFLVCSGLKSVFLRSNFLNFVCVIVKFFF